MINLYLHYFKHKTPARKAELDFCVKQNINNKNFDKIYLLLENELDVQDWMNKPNVIIVNINKRMNFKDMFEYINTINDIEEKINIISNLDIFFDNTISKLNNHNVDNHFITLTRWDLNIKTKQAKFFNTNCSQDTWIWKGKVDLNNLDLDFGFATPGCDNAICGVFHEAGYKVINPSLDLKSYHLHQDTSRSYTDNDVVRKRLYLLTPTEDWNSSLIQYWKDCTNFQPNI